MAERERALVAHLTPLQSGHGGAQPQEALEIALDNMYEDLLESKTIMQQWGDPSRYRPSTEENTDNDPSVSLPVAQTEMKPRTNFISWDVLSQTSKTIILKEISDHLVSFQTACELLSLEPNEVQEFLEKHEHAKQRTVKWREQLDRWRQHQELPDEDDDASGAGINTITEECVAQMCEFLDFMGLNQYSGIISGWKNRTVLWPPEIHTPRFNYMNLFRGHLGFPQSGHSSKRRILLDIPVFPRPAEDGMMGFCSPLYVDEDNFAEVRVRYFLVPAGTIVIGPNGWKRLHFGGRYRIIYPDDDRVHPALVSEFNISASSISLSSPRDKSRNQLSHHEEQDLNNVSQPDQNVTGDHRGDRAQTESDQETVDLSPEGSRDHTENSPAVIPEHGSVQDTAEEIPLLAQESNQTHKDTAKDNFWDGREVFFDLTRRAPQSTKNPPKGRFAPQHHKPTFMANMVKGLEEMKDPEVAEQRLADIFTMSVDVNSPGAIQERQIMPQALHEEGMWMLNNPQIINQTQGPSETVRPSDIFMSAYQLEMSKQNGKLPDNSSNGHPEPSAREKKDANHELVRLGDSLHGVMYQMVLPLGYRVEAPTGYITNFDSQHEGPIDGVCPPGSGGQYTFVLSHAMQTDAASQKMWLLPPQTLFRVYIPDDLKITRNGSLLLNTLDGGCFHHFTVVNDRMDFVSEYGPHRLFEQEAIPPPPVPELIIESIEEDDDETIIDENEVNEDETTTEEDPNEPQQQDESSSSETEPEHEDDDTNLASPLREAKRILAPYKERLRAREEQEKAEDRARAAQEEHDLRSQFLREEAELRKKREREEAEARARAAGDSNNNNNARLGRGQRQRKRNTENQSLGFIEYSTAGMEIEEDAEDQEDWRPPRPRPRRPDPRRQQRQQQRGGRGGRGGAQAAAAAAAPHPQPQYQPPQPQLQPQSQLQLQPRPRPQLQPMRTLAPAPIPAPRPIAAAAVQGGPPAGDTPTRKRKRGRPRLSPTLAGPPAAIPRAPAWAPFQLLQPRFPEPPHGGARARNTFGTALRAPAQRGGGVAGASAAGGVGGSAREANPNPGQARGGKGTVEDPFVL
ncbi:hypothetical protein F4809DRAFT_659120 [Biscogniauxia mediterranea]|nr:hypothetical protein F4809DRAFT_659120 [Biscogniauxia mediterranea]